MGDVGKFGSCTGVFSGCAEVGDPRAPEEMLSATGELWIRTCRLVWQPASKQIKTTGGIRVSNIKGFRLEGPETGATKRKLLE